AHQRGDGEAAGGFHAAAGSGQAQADRRRGPEARVRRGAVRHLGPVRHPGRLPQERPRSAAVRRDVALEQLGLTSAVMTVGAAQLGPIARDESRSNVAKRLVGHLHEARARGCDLVVFPELALTTFFPRWWMDDQTEIDAFFEREMPGPETRPLFDEARRLGIGFCVGYAELVSEPGGAARRFNTPILVDQTGRLVGKYRKIHLPGHAEHEPWRPFQHLEKRYFEVGDLGWGVWPAFGGLMGLCICNDRRWPETYRVMGLQGVEMVLLGYNTPVHNPPAPEHDLLANFHNQLSMQA